MKAIISECYNLRMSEKSNDPEVRPQHRIVVMGIHLFIFILHLPRVSLKTEDGDIHRWRAQY